MNCFASEPWLQHCRQQALAMGLRGDPFTRVPFRRLKHSLRPSRWSHAIASFAKGSLPDFETPDHLRPLVDLIGQRPCSILDIGGGWGDNYLLIGRALYRTIDQIDYTILDLPSLMALGKELYSSSCYRPKFVAAFPDKHFDIVLLCGSLQYIKHWQLILHSSMAQANAIYITRTPIAASAHWCVQVTHSGACELNVFSESQLQVPKWNLRHFTVDGPTPDYLGRYQPFYHTYLWQRGSYE